LTWNGRPIDWVNVAYFGAIHALALTAPWYFSWSRLGLVIVLLWVSCSLGICLAYHRLLTHRGFRLWKPLEYLFTVFGTLASEGGAITWVAMHRIHHAQSDRPGRDLHTPKDGFWWSHFGWIITRGERKRDELENRFAPELVADPFHRMLDRLHLVPNILLGFALYAWDGWGAVVWGSFLRIALGVNATWFVNSAAHVWGYRTYETPEGSRNLWWVGLVAWGEGWHNNHHAFQRSARHGLAWWELDPTWLAIRSLQALGLARDVHLLPKNAERFRLRGKTETAPAAA
jgi:fatty-acid desaturase